jgi:hypothetical protein
MGRDPLDGNLVALKTQGQQLRGNIVGFLGVRPTLFESVDKASLSQRMQRGLGRFGCSKSQEMARASAS